MPASNIDSHCRAIWNRALNAPELSAVTPELIQEWALDRGLGVGHAEQRDVGAFVRIPAIVLTLQDKKACFPKVPVTGDADWDSRRQVADSNVRLWEKMEFFSPLWIAMGTVSKILDDVRNCSKKRAIELFDYHTSTLYTIPFQAVCIAQVVPATRSLNEFGALAREAFLAFYSGYRASSISALIPTIEGGLTRLASSSGSGPTISTKVDVVIDRAIRSAARAHYDGMWVPDAYLDKDYLFGEDELVFTFETFRRWLHRSFFRSTGEYDGVTWLNRHVFAHGIESSWQQSANFSRLIVALATLAFVESWHDESHVVSAFFPSMNEDAKLLWQQALFQGSAQATLKQIEQQRYQEHGRLVPEMPTDDGVTLRKAILSDDCINDLVRPLREAGWQVAMGEPDERALYVTVVATAGAERLEVSLLYSCATDNVIYRKLAETSQAILYRGSPYHQKQFAYGVGIHVGPVAGWLPPLPLHPRPVRRSRRLWRQLRAFRARLGLNIKGALVARPREPPPA